mgnify:FL=1|jgi:hypothetical protein|tara:strand:+ start:174 stop:704 length:531 start_codon:yes stop_codon:yes gene_type:complete
MQDIYDIVKNIEGIYDNNTSFQVLKDFERVLDELDIYVYANWQEGELASGPKIERHWVTCSFMWDMNKMPDPMGGQRLLDYDCKVFMGKDHVIKPRKIRSADDVRPGTKKGKLDKSAIWIVTIQMPKKLIADIYSGSTTAEKLANITATEVAQPADDTAMEVPLAPDAPVPDEGAI